MDELLLIIFGTPLLFMFSTYKKAFQLCEEIDIKCDKEKNVNRKIFPISFYWALLFGYQQLFTGL